MRFMAWMGSGLIGAGCNSDDGTGDSDTCGGGTSRTADILCLTADTANGATVYGDRCAVCHGPAGAGLGPPFGSDIRGKPAVETVEVILDPPTGMTESLKDFMSDQDIADVAGYVETLPTL